MLRVNLLPPYIYEGAKRRNVSIVWAVLALIVVGGFLFAKTRIDSQTNSIKEETEARRPDKEEAERKQAEATRINQESTAVREKRDFVKLAKEYDTTTYPPLVYNIRNYTIRDVLYSSLQPASNTVTMDAWAPSLAKVGQYMMWMERNPKISNVSVAMSNIPGFPRQAQPRQPDYGQLGYGAQQQAGFGPNGITGYDFLVTLTLLQPVPGPPVYGGAEQGGGPGGPMMGGPMMGGPMMGGPGMMGPMGPGGPGMMSPGMPGPMGPGASGPMIGPVPGGGGGPMPRAGATSGRGGSRRGEM